MKKLNDSCRFIVVVTVIITALFVLAACAPSGAPYTFNISKDPAPKVTPVAVSSPEAGESLPTPSTTPVPIPQGGFSAPSVTPEALETPSLAVIDIPGDDAESFEKPKPVVPDLPDTPKSLPDGGEDDLSGQDGLSESLHAGPADAKPVLNDVPAAKKGDYTLIRGATVYTPDKIIENGDILLNGPKIRAVGIDLSAPEDALIIEAQGMCVYPGFVCAFMPVGFIDANDVPDIQPTVRAIDALDPTGAPFASVFSTGVTTACVGADLSALDGMASVLKTYGYVVDDMLIKENGALVSSLENGAVSAYDTMRNVARLRQALLEAQVYARSGGKGDLGKDAVSGALRGRYPLFVEAGSMQEILSALRLADEFNVKLAVVGAEDCISIVDKLAKKNVSVLLRVTDESAPAANALYEAGADFGLIPAPGQTMAEAINAAVNAGLPVDEAVKAATQSPAKILSAEARVGSIAKNRDADLVLFSGDSLEDGEIKKVIVNGAVVYEK